MISRHTMLRIKGNRPLVGEVSSSGSKNAALPILAACILLEGEYTLSNVPNLLDIHTMIKMLHALGLRADFRENNDVVIGNYRQIKHSVPYDLVTAMRASFFVAGPILARTGFAKVPLPGGCAIGARPLDLHFKGFEAMGAKIRIEHGFVEMRAKVLKGANIYLDFPSVGATENILMAASLAEGTTIIENAAKEPEISDLCYFLKKAGAKIEGVGTSCLEIEGVSELVGQSYQVIPDRIEVGTLMMAALITKGSVTIKHVVSEHLTEVTRKLMEMGATVVFDNNSVFVEAKKPLAAVDIETRPFPGFPTDMQAQMMALLSLAKGTSCIKEEVFENRFMHAQELMRMGAQIRIHKDQAVVKGVKALSSAQVKITDLRAGAALVMASLAAEGESVIYGLHHLKRGYDQLWKKLEALGALVSFS